jgi:hypothetical protein
VGRRSHQLASAEGAWSVQRRLRRRGCVVTGSQCICSPAQRRFHRSSHACRRRTGS